MRRSYTATARRLHWITALLVIGMIPAGLVMTQDGLDRSLQNALFAFHKNFGVIVLLLVLWRLIYRAANPAPPLPASVPGWQAAIASATHWLLYGLLLVMAVSGYVRVAAGGFPIEAMDWLGIPKLIPKSESVAETAQMIHGITRFPLIVLILLHVGAAMKHLFITRDGVFQRMWPGR